MQYAAKLKYIIHDVVKNTYKKPVVYRRDDDEEDERKATFLS